MGFDWEKVREVIEQKKIDILAVVIACTLLGIGAAVMNACERANERSEYEAFAEYEEEVIAEIKAIFDTTSDLGLEEYNQFWAQFSNYSDARASAPSLDSLNWDYAGSAFFAMTVMTTIGYGTFAPATDGGKVFTIFYALIAIPTFAFTLAVVSEGIKNAGKKMSYAIVNKFFISADADPNSVEVKNKHLWGFVGLSVFCFFTILVFAQAFNSAYADWSYLDSVYFNIITLSTVGLGDYAPDPEAGSSAKMAGFAFFIIFGLAAIGSMLAVIQDSITQATEKMISKASSMKMKVSKSGRNLMSDEEESTKENDRRAVPTRFHAASQIRQDLQKLQDAEAEIERMQKEIEKKKRELLAIESEEGNAEEQRNI